MSEKGADFQFGDVSSIHEFLDTFGMSRIGIRILIGQYIELRHAQQQEGYVGLIDLNTSPAEVFSQAVEDAKYLCERAHGDSPEVILQGRTDLTFSYIPSHLYYCMFELLKNSLRATCEHHGVDHGPMPTIKVIIADGETNEDIVIKISDEGGGIRRSHMPRIWSYLFTTAQPAFGGDENPFSSAGDHGTDSPLAGLVGAAALPAVPCPQGAAPPSATCPSLGLSAMPMSRACASLAHAWRCCTAGYGLPISRSYARYFGDLSHVDGGHGTDAFLHLPRLGDRDEPLHDPLHCWGGTSGRRRRRVSDGETCVLEVD